MSKVMNIQTEKISEIQFLSLITAFIQGSVLWISFTTNLTNHDTWLAVLTGLLISIPFVLCYASLGKMFAGRSFIQILEAILGRYLGRAVAILYIGYFGLLLIYNIEGFGEFQNLIIPDVSSIITIILFTAICAYGVFKGIETLARLGIFFVLTGFSIILSTFFLLLKDFNLLNFLPLFENPYLNFLHSIHIIITIPFCEIVIFLTLMPCLNDARNTGKYTLLGLLLGGLSLFLISVRNTAVLGNTEALWTSPSFQVTRLINIGTVLTRMDLLTAIGHTVELFVKCTIIYYCLVLSLSQLLRLKTHTPLIIPIGCISVSLAMNAFESTTAHALDAQNFTPVYASLFSLVLPPLLLLIAKVRGLPDKNTCFSTAKQPHAKERALSKE